jgi:hypothetical protein
MLESKGTLMKKFLFCSLLMWCACASAQSAFPTIRLDQIPDVLQQQYRKVKPDFTEMSHCATAFDSPMDADKMAFRCSIYIKMSAEGERRAIRYCEEKRQELKIHNPCQVIVEH